MESIFETIADEAIKYLVLYTQKTIERISEESSKKISDKLFTLYDKVKLQFNSKDDEYNLSKFTENPQRYKNEIKSIMIKKMKKDKDFTSQIEMLIDELKLLKIESLIENTKAKEIVSQDIGKARKGEFKSIIRNSIASKSIIGQKIDSVG